MFNGFGFSIRNWKTAVNFSVETETPLLKPKNRLDFVLIYRRMIVINIERTKTAVDTETADKPRQLLTNWSAQTRSWFVCFLSEPHGSSSKRFELKRFFFFPLEKLPLQRHSRRQVTDRRAVSLQSCHESRICIPRKIWQKHWWEDERDICQRKNCWQPKRNSFYYEWSFAREDSNDHENRKNEKRKIEKNHFSIIGRFFFSVSLRGKSRFRD